jgi:hypothetical protein
LGPHSVDMELYSSNGQTQSVGAQAIVNRLAFLQPARFAVGSQSGNKPRQEDGNQVQGLVSAQMASYCGYKDLAQLEQSASFHLRTEI